MAERGPIRDTDDDARALARSLLAGARFAALAVFDRATGIPTVSRIALVPGPEGAPLTLISELSAHTGHLLADPRCALLVGEPGPAGDPLTHPRMTLACRADFVRHGDAGHAALRSHYLGLYPKAKLYADFADFLFARFEVSSAALNGGFGKAYQLAPEDLGL
ncbi:HugZ family pyridoxamine 5'-phosphate oxidase [Mangrovicoccus ximenensis]|uniref:HugZ family pyridoxamine 5'-phosphate oxidase n=1 Tax=Mangrovicoccus ximenensis TaxID=1911570 RepID=UPI000D3C4628|nr:pyridoxamine 5'-phosphate oxidase family protein [Mangrovicoccus ximenensis]